MDRNDRVFFMPDGTNIEYSISGSGSKLLWIHGSNQLGSVYDGLIEYLARRYTVLSMSRRGWGNSGSKGLDYSMDTECSDVMEFMKAFSIESICGEDFGAVIALHVAMRTPVARMVLLNPYLTSLRKLGWLPKFTRQVRKNDYFGAMATYVKATKNNSVFLPSFFLKFIFKHSSFSIDRDKQMVAKMLDCGDSEYNKRNRSNIESEEWKQRKRMLKNTADELRAAQGSEQELEGLDGLTTRTLLIRERDGEPFVRDAVSLLATVLRQCEGIEASSTSRMFSRISDFLTEWGVR